MKHDMMHELLKVKFQAEMLAELFGEACSDGGRNFNGNECLALSGFLEDIVKKTQKIWEGSDGTGEEEPGPAKDGKR